MKNKKAKNWSEMGATYLLLILLPLGCLQGKFRGKIMNALRYKLCGRMIYTIGVCKKIRLSDIGCWNHLLMQMQELDYDYWCLLVSKQSEVPRHGIDQICIKLPLGKCCNQLHKIQARHNISTFNKIYGLLYCQKADHRQFRVTLLSTYNRINLYKTVWLQL